MKSSRRPTIGMVLFADATFDSRVRREARTLADAGFQVVLACLADAGGGDDLPESVRVVVCRPTSATALPGVGNPYIAPGGGRLRRLWRRAGWLLGYLRNARSWGRLVAETVGPVDAWHAHDLPALAAIAPARRRDVPVVYDSHELFLEAGTARRLPGIARGALRLWERRLVARVVAVVTVNEALASELDRRYRPRRTIVVHNCPRRWTPDPSATDVLRQAAGIPAGAPVVLYHGSIGPGRGVEQLLEALREPGLEQAHLIAMGPGVFMDRYRALFDDPRWVGRAHLLDAVPPDELLSWVSWADVGGVIIQRSTLNHVLATPNKLFECLAAGVPVLASDFPTMRTIILDDEMGPLGATCDPTDPASIAGGLRELLSVDRPYRDALRARCLAAAHRRWNWEQESEQLVALYSEILDPPGSRVP